MKLLGEYTNGNTHVRIFDDGTKIRETKEDKFIPEFPECIDLKITNYCNKNCPYCHEDSSIAGLHGDILQVPFINTLQPFTEVAIGGGNPLSHPKLATFLYKLKDLNVIANITINQDHFMLAPDLIKYLSDNKLIRGVGISLTNSSDKELLKSIKTIPNVVIHTINGITTYEDYESLSYRGLKVLILGYKNLRRGIGYYSTNVKREQRDLYMMLPFMIKDKWFDVLSFDNLALEQLNVKGLMSEEEWNSFYMGDDGQFTMYIDLVKKEFARSSVSEKRFKLLDNIKDMFSVQRNSD